MYHEKVDINGIIAKYIRDEHTYVLSVYSEKGRYYHNVSHLNYLLDRVPSDVSIEEYVLTAVFHDIVYDPRSLHNEEKSINFFTYVIEKDFLDTDLYKNVCANIRATKHCPCPDDVLNRLSLTGQEFIKKDQAVCYSQDFNELLKWEYGIRKEYSMYSYSNYCKGRVNFLRKFVNLNPKILDLIEYVKNYQPKVGVYVGSFNPFHVGHLNIVHQAEKVFDKVVIVQGVNPDKNSTYHALYESVCGPNSELKYYQVKYGVTNTPRKLREIQEENLTNSVQLIRGIRNGDDLMYEENQLKWMKEMDPNISSVFFLCDKEFSHVSSSGIKAMMKVDLVVARKFIV